MKVVNLAAEATRDLRRRVLYGHWPEAEVCYPEDELAGAFHLGVVDDDHRLVAVASWYPQPAPGGSERPAYRLRGMAVEPRSQRAGAGRLLFEAGKAEAARRGAELVWANSRDSALGFYIGLGMTVVGDGFTAAGGLPHHVVVGDC